MTEALVGTNIFQRNQLLNKLIEQFVEKHGDLALEKIEANTAEYNHISGAIESLPFLAAKKMVVIYDLSQNKEAAENIDKLVNLAEETTDLIIVESKLDKRGVYYKTLKKITSFNEFGEMDEAGLTKWLIEETGTRKAKISRADADYLVQRVGADQLRLSNELTKLIQYNSEITRKSIEELTEQSPSSTIFNLVDSIFSGNTKQAIKIYDEQRKLRVEPQAIHGMLVWQMHAVTVASMAPEGASSADIAKDAGMSPFVVQKSQKIARSMGRAKIKEFMTLLRDFDYRSKHEVFDYDDALRYAILSLAK